MLYGKKYICKITILLHPLQVLKDRITESETHVFGQFMTTDELKLLENYIPNLFSYIPRLNGLKRMLGTTLNIIDYDETLQHRHYQLQDGRLQDNRGRAGNRIIDEVIGRDPFLQSHYKKDSVVSRIASILHAQDDYHSSRVMTAGEYSWQTSKTKESGVFDKKNGIFVVDEGFDKIGELLEVIISLGYIPSKIIIYEDRPEHFQATAQALSKFLGGVEIVVNHVILSQKEVIKRQIEEIQQGIYIRK